MKIDIEELKRLAEAATPGPWVAAFNTNMDNKVCHSFGDICQTGKDIGDAIFIAAANPAAVLALIEQHEAAHSELLATRDDNHSMMLEIHNLRIERDALVAELAKLRKQEPVAWMREDGNLYLAWQKDLCLPEVQFSPLYARPVPAAVAVPAIDIETILDASTATMCQCLRSRLLASEVRRLRDEVNGLTGSLDRAEKALKEAQEQKPVAWINLNKWTPSNGPQCVTPEEYEKKLELLTKLTAVYAAPAPAPAVPAEWREVMTELADDLSIELDMRYQSRSHYPSELRKYENEMQLVYRARALLQSEVRHD